MIGNMAMTDDLHHALRALRSHPGPLAGAVLTLALAIGINAAKTRHPSVWRAATRGSRSRAAAR